MSVFLYETTVLFIWWIKHCHETNCYKANWPQPNQINYTLRRLFLSSFNFHIFHLAFVECQKVSRKMKLPLMLIWWLSMSSDMKKVIFTHKEFAPLKRVQCSKQGNCVKWIENYFRVSKNLDSLSVVKNILYIRATFIGIHTKYIKIFRRTRTKTKTKNNVLWQIDYFVTIIDLQPTHLLPTKYDDFKHKLAFSATVHRLRENLTFHVKNEAGWIKRSSPNDTTASKRTQKVKIVC